MILVENKLDLKSDSGVTQENIDKISKETGVSCYVETSAKIGAEIDQLFHEIMSTKPLSAYCSSVPLEEKPSATYSYCSCHFVCKHCKNAHGSVIKRLFATNHGLPVKMIMMSRFKIRDQ